MLLVTKNLAELCTLLIDDIYGELPSRIFAALLNHGRAGVPQLAQYTSLTPRQLRHGLAVLMQYDLLYYQAGEGSGDGTTLYEANPEAAYNLLRAGKVLEMVESLHGADAKDVVQNLLALGHTRIADLKDAYTAKIAKWEKAHVDFNASANGHAQANGQLKSSVANGNGNHFDADNGEEERDYHHEDENNEDTSTSAQAAIETTSIRSMNHLNAVLCRLITAEIVDVVSPESFQSFSDRYEDAQAHIEATFYPEGIRGSRKKEESVARVAELLRTQRDEPRKLKRTLETSGGGRFGSYGGSRAKLRRLLNGDDIANGRCDDDERGPPLDPKTILRINFDRCAVELRNQRLVRAAAVAIGETTAKIYATLLRQLTETIPRCRGHPLMDVPGSDFLRQRNIHTDDVFEHLDAECDIFAGIGKADVGQIDVPTAERLERHAKVDTIILGNAADEDEDENMDDEDYDSEGDVSMTPVVRAAQNGNNSLTGVNGVAGANGVHTAPGRVKFADSVDDDGGGLSSYPATAVSHSPSSPLGREIRLQQMRQHLLLLCEHRLRFLRHCERGQWTVDFESLVRRLREAELDNAIERKAGRAGLRLARILRDKGKLDEKTLPTMALMKKGDVQNKMLEMQMHGFVDMQEVPRDNNRSAARTLFLWFCDPSRAMDTLLDNTYKAMVRCLRIRDVHRYASREVLDFVERPDVKGRESEALEKKYYDRYQQYCHVESKLMGQVMRLDSLVATLRDY